MKTIGHSPMAACLDLLFCVCFEEMSNSIIIKNLPAQVSNNHFLLDADISALDLKLLILVIGASYVSSRLEEFRAFVVGELFVLMHCIFVASSSSIPFWSR